MNKFNSPRTARNIERMLSLLSKSALSSHEIRIYLHMSGNTVWQYLSYLRSKKKVRISGWSFDKESGMSYRSIAKIVGTSATTARKYYNHLSQ